MSLYQRYQRYRRTYPSYETQRMSSVAFGINTSRSILPNLNMMSIKFYNFFMKFGYMKEDRHDKFKYKSEVIVVDPKSLDLEQYKLEQLHWIKDPVVQNLRRSSYIKNFEFIQECKHRIRVFLDDLDNYAIDRIDLRSIIDEGYKITFQSTLRPRPRGYGFHESFRTNTSQMIIQQVQHDATVVNLLTSLNQSAFRAFTPLGL